MTVTVELSALWVLSAACLPAVPVKVGESVVVVEFAVGEVSVTVGAAVSMTKVDVAVPLFPAASVWVTWTVYWALPVSAAGVTDQVPAVVAAVSVCNGEPVAVDPAKIFTVTLVASAL